MYPRPSFEGWTPSAIRNVVARPCSAITFRDRSSRGSFPCVRPERVSATSSIGRSRSVSNTFSTPWSTIATRSSDEPVSTFFAGNGPVTCSSWSTWSWMKTRFQISMNRSSSTSGPPSGPYFEPRSTKISLHGPPGPAVCVCQ